MVFGGSQVLIDLEPGYKLIFGGEQLHGATHTFLGAIGIGLVATVIGKPISEFALKLMAFRSHTISWSASACGAFLGTFSHIVLDSIMHSDMHPWSPFSTANPLLGALPLDTLHLGCLLLAAAGGIGVWLRYKFGNQDV